MKNLKHGDRVQVNGISRSREVTVWTVQGYINSRKLANPGFAKTIEDAKKLGTPLTPQLQVSASVMSDVGLDDYIENSVCLMEGEHVLCEGKIYQLDSTDFQLTWEAGRLIEVPGGFAYPAEVAEQLEIRITEEGACAIKSGGFVLYGLDAHVLAAIDSFGSDTFMLRAMLEATDAKLTLDLYQPENDEVVWLVLNHCGARLAYTEIDKSSYWTGTGAIDAAEDCGFLRPYTSPVTATQEEASKAFAASMAKVWKVVCTQHDQGSPPVTFTRSNHVEADKCAGFMRQCGYLAVDVEPGSI
jgi:hypothetical protein